MGTTALIVEMVIIGFQVLIWMVLITLFVFGYNWIDVSKFKDWVTLISIALVGVSYTLGIIFDGFIATLFAPWEYRSRRWLPTQYTGNPGRMRAYITATSADASEELTRRANRSSLIRATSLNLLIISICSLIFVKRYFGWHTKLMILIVVFSILLTVLALLTWQNLLRGYYFYLIEIYEALIGNSEIDLTRSAPTDVTSNTVKPPHS